MHKGADSGDGWGLLVSGSQSLGKESGAGGLSERASSLRPTVLPTVPSPPSLLVRHLLPVLPSDAPMLLARDLNGLM